MHKQNTWHSTSKARRRNKNTNAGAPRDKLRRVPCHLPPRCASLPYTNLQSTHLPFSIAAEGALCAGTSVKHACACRQPAATPACCWQAALRGTCMLCLAPATQSCGTTASCSGSPGAPQPTGPRPSSCAAQPLTLQSPSAPKPLKAAARHETTTVPAQASLPLCHAERTRTLTP